MCQTGSEFCHLVHLVNTLACKEVQSVEILFVAWEKQFLVGLLNADHCLEDGALTVLNPLTHRVEVCCEVARCWEYAFLVFAFALTVELLPPFAHEVKFRLEVHHDLNLLAVLVKTVTNGSILCCWVLCKWHILAACFLHFLSTLYKCLDVEACACYRQQSHRSEHRETTSHIVWDDETLISFLVGTSAGSTFLRIGDGNNHFLCFLLANLVFTLLLQKTEGESSLSSRSTLRDVDNSELLSLQVFCKFAQIVFADIVASEKNCGRFLVAYKPCKTVAKCFNYRLSTKI